jgi:hypothetical protein
MGRSEIKKLTSKVARTSTLTKRGAQSGKSDGKKFEKKTKKRKLSNEIEAVDINEDYVLPNQLEIPADDLLIFEQLEKKNTKNNNLAVNLEKFAQNQVKLHPEKDPEVAAVYTK